ncbi:putative mucin-associated surface protein (MASP) [Trypanosoma rangeli]|uniref:Putative mucin-associated surface protein (MASP) n=1 Tax=Trypanosoma rangeli TaxID=5698 RepID=A0A3R7K777_TRYRA|nr:putative mucin-associated surface protein (MASP) [Trypanosoma rangeli]RNF01094.1 putative mucin-associated surface protein (MASP) [Trypanosoma rangeli]|eukprot:RNF01094.1 putative mucin-associated surface protein (MASP) [Trypanosoma rangeli]
MLATRNVLCCLVLLLSYGSVGTFADAASVKARRQQDVVGRDLTGTKAQTSVNVPTDLKETRSRALRATEHAFNNATEASKHCSRAKVDANEAKNHATEAKKLLETLGGDFVSKSTALQDAKRAHNESVAALKNCVDAEKAAADADTAVVLALYWVLNHSKVQRPTGLTLNEAMESVHQNTLQAVNEAKKAELEADKAAEAAHKAAEAAKKAATALVTAKEVVTMAGELKKQLAKEELERRQKHEAAVAAEKRRIQEEASKAVKRAEAAEELVAELSSAHKRGAKDSTRSTRVGADGAQNPRNIGLGGNSYVSALASSLLLLLAMTSTFISITVLC